MKPTLASLFPNASASTVAANPQLMAPNGGSGKQNDVQTILKPRRGKIIHDKDTNNGSVSYSEPKCNETPALGGSIQGKTKGIHRITVRFTGFRCKPLDPDNFAGSCKDLLDGLRHAGLISGDEPWKIKLETEQERVSSYAQERTLIEIEFP